MNVKHLFVAVPATLFILGNGAANAGQAIDRVGAMACITDKWDEKEPEKGHKLVDAAMRCVLIQNDAAAEKATQDCVGKYEYMPDASWKGNGTCTDITIKVARSTKAGKRDRTSIRNTRGNIPVAQANMKAPAAAVRISTKA